MDTKEGEKEKKRDIGMMKYVNDVDQKVLVREKEIKDRWMFYFDKLFNGDQRRDIGDISIPHDMINREFMQIFQNGIE